MNEAVALGGLLVALCAVWLNFAERRAKPREVIYEKQIEAFHSIHAALTEVYNTSQGFLVAHMRGLTDQARLEFRESLAKGSIAPAYVGLSRARQQWALFLPRKVQQQLSEFEETLNGLSAPSVVLDQYPPELVNSPDPMMALSRSYMRVVEALREGLGVDPLSQDILRVIGRAPSSSHDIMAAS